MKKALLFFTIVLLKSSGFSQKITQTEATDLLKKSFSYLISSDTASFIELYYLDNSSSSHHQPYSKFDLVRDFEDIQNFLVVPIYKKLPFDRVEITDFSNTSILAKAKIKAYFKIDDHLQLAYGFLVDYINNKWVLRWHGERTISPNN